MKMPLRVRISTCLLGIGLILFPVAALWVRPTYFPTAPMLLHNALSWLYFECAPQLLAVAFVAAFVSALWLGFHRQWVSVVQCILEMAISLGAAFFIPTY